MRLIVRDGKGFEASHIPAGNAERVQVPVGGPEEGRVTKVFAVPDPFLNEGDPLVELR